MSSVTVIINDFSRCNAKLLWKRITSEEKSSEPLLGLIWSVGQKLWFKDHNDVFSLLKKTEWPELVRPYMKCLEESYRQKSILLISKAYLSIGTDKFADLLGYTEQPEEAEKMLNSLQDQGWVLDAVNKLIIPKQSVLPAAPWLKNEDQLQSLTQFVSFLEN